MFNGKNLFSSQIIQWIKSELTTSFPLHFCEEIVVFTIKNEENLLFGLFRAGSLDSFSELKLLAIKT